jgi:hypothetical protein
MTRDNSRALFLLSVVSLVLCFGCGSGARNVDRPFWIKRACTYIIVNYAPDGRSSDLEHELRKVMGKEWQEVLRKRHNEGFINDAEYVTVFRIKTLHDAVVGDPEKEKEMIRILGTIASVEKSDEHLSAQTQADFSASDILERLR